MAKPNASIYAAKVIFNNVTYDTTAGGPQGVNAEEAGTNLPFFSGNAHWPVWNPIVQNQCGLTVELSEYTETIAIGTKATLTVQLELPDGNVANVPYNNMRFVGSTASQTFGRYSNRVLRFVYEAATGTTAPRS